MTTVSSHVTPPLRSFRVEPGLGRRARQDSAVRAAAALGLWFGLLLVTYWWVADGGVQDFGGWASGLTSLGRLTGLVASVLLLAQVIAG